jgi:hypothetical protein
MFETNWKRVWISPMRTFCSGPRTLVHPDEPDRICGVGENREKPWLDLTEFRSCTPIRCDLFYNHRISTHILHIIHIHICVFVSFAFAVFVSREDKTNQSVQSCMLSWSVPFGSQLNFNEAGSSNRLGTWREPREGWDGLMLLLLFCVCELSMQSR